MKIMRKFSEEDREEMITLLKGLIDTYYDKDDIDRMKASQKRLKDKFGVEYSPFRSDEKIIASLEDLYLPQDFRTFGEYQSYCFDIYKLRFQKFSSFLNGKYERKKLSISEVRDSLEKEGYFIEERDRKNDSAIAFVGSGKTITINTAHEDFVRDTILLRILIHELGHVFENEKKLVQKDDFTHNLTYASSENILNPSEVFAEHFAHYFLEPSYLKKGWPEVYKEMNSYMDSFWKKLIESLIR